MRTIAVPIYFRVEIHPPQTEHKAIMGNKMQPQPANAQQRTEQQIRDHYEIEKKLAEKLLNAPREERAALYTELYDELFRLVPNHPQLTRKKSEEQKQDYINEQMILLSRLVDANKTFLEIGPGDCSLSFEICSLAKKVYAADVSETITKSSNTPDNFQLIISNGCDIPVPEGTIDVAYSNQLMEHLHPDDAFGQLKNVFTALVPGGAYLCITPNRLSGPHDISKYFDTVATCFHLKEYTVTELSRQFKDAGFSRVAIYIGARGKFIKFPVFPSIICEKFLELLPHRLKQLLVHTKLVRLLTDPKIIGIKQKTKSSAVRY